MQSAIEKYQEMILDLFPTEKYVQLFQSFDKKMVHVLINQGYAPAEIKQVIAQESPALENNIDTPARMAYANALIPKEFRNIVAFNISSKDEIYAAYSVAQKEASSHIAELFLQYDLQIVCTMLDQSYSLQEIRGILNEYSMFASKMKTISPSSSLYKNYADAVMDHVNEVRERKVGEKKDLAEKFYISRCSKGKKLSFAQEGNLILSILVDGFSPTVVEDVLSEHSASAKDNPSYSRDLTEQCVRLKKIYDALKSKFSPALIRKDARIAYFYFASEYMRKNKLSTLNIQGEQCIVRNMLTAGMSEAFIRKAVSYSPIAAEPWRNKEQYIDSIFFKVQDNKYFFTSSKYDEKITRLQEMLSASKVPNMDVNRNYYDGIIAYELLKEHHLRKNVERAIEERSQSGNLDYAKSIVDAVCSALRAEEAILEAPLKNIPPGNSYIALKENGVTAGDLYKAAVSQRIRNYPSTAGRLTAAFVDKDAVENLFTLYPDMVRSDLETALRTHSPRSFMPGTISHYPSHVIDDVNARLEDLAQQQEKQLEFQQELVENTREERDAFTAGSSIWNLKLCTGLAAIRMLEEGHQAKDILPALIQPPDITEKDAEQIIFSAKNVLARMEHIQQYRPFSEEARKQIRDSEVLAADDYQRFYQEIQVDKNILMSDIDIEIAKKMLLNGYEQRIICDIVRQFSPTASEPGRNPDYSNYIEEQAELAIEKERERLKYYRPMPRNKHEDDAEKEYEYHLHNMQTTFFLPHEPLMDMLIAEAMIIQGFSAVQIGAAMQKLSPCSGKEADYGFTIVRSSSERSLDTEKGLITAPVRIRMRGKEDSF